VKDLEPRGKSVDYMRGKLKDKYRPEILKRIAEPDPVAMRNKYKTLQWDAPDKGAAALDQARYQEMIEYLRDLESSDKGAMFEKWYQKVHGDKSARHLRVTIDAMKEAGVELGDVGELDRVPDLLDDDVVHDLKAVEGPLGGRDKKQFRTFTKLIGRNVKIGDSQVLIKGARATFPFPAGARANSTWMLEWLEENPAVTFEVFNPSGETRIIGAAEAGELKTKKFWDWLGVKPPQGVE